MRFRKDGIDSIARAKAARDILDALPGIWTKSLTEDVLAPKKACIPVQPSRPIVAISITLPSIKTATTETTPLSGKKTWSSELSASMRTCSLWQRMCSSSGMSRLRLRDGSASKRRFRGQFDKAFMSYNRARFRVVPRESELWRYSFVLHFSARTPVVRQGSATPEGDARVESGLPQTAERRHS